MLPLETWVGKDVLMVGPFPLKTYILVDLPIVYQKPVITFKHRFKLSKGEKKRKYIMVHLMYSSTKEFNKTHADQLILKVVDSENSALCLTGNFSWVAGIWKYNLNSLLFSTLAKLR